MEQKKIGHIFINVNTVLFIMICTLIYIQTNIPGYISKHKLCIVWDSINGGIAGVSYNDNKFEKNWEINIRPTMQPIYFEQSNELVINHFDDKSDYLVVIDVLEGKILSKVNLRTPMANGMFLTPGFNNDVLYCSTLAISKVSW